MILLKDDWHSDRLGSLAHWSCWKSGPSGKTKEKRGEGRTEAAHQLLKLYTTFKVTRRVASFGPWHQCLLCLSCSSLLGLAGLAETSFIPTRCKAEPRGRFLGIWVRELGQGLCLKTVFSKEVLVAAPKLQCRQLRKWRGVEKKIWKKKERKKNPTTHWVIIIIIFKSRDLENKQNVIKNFYSVFCLFNLLTLICEIILPFEINLNCMLLWWRLG